MSVNHVTMQSGERVVAAVNFPVRASATAEPETQPNSVDDSTPTCAGPPWKRPISAESTPMPKTPAQIRVSALTYAMSSDSGTTRTPFGRPVVPDEYSMSPPAVCPAIGTVG